MLIDAQVHVVSPDREQYPLNPPRRYSPQRQVDPAREAESPWYERHGMSVEAVIAAQDALGIERGVLVQAYSAYQFDNRYTAASAATHPERYACTLGVDLTDDPVATARRLVDEHHPRALRLFLNLTVPGWLEGPDADGFLDEVASLGVVAQMLLQAEQLPTLLPVAKRHPDVPILVDHCAYPDLSGGPGYPNARGLFALGEAGNVHLKLSTHVFDLARQGGAPLPRLAEDLVADFGAGRIMWASDLTVQERSYAEVLADAHEACSGLSAPDRDKILGETAAAFWWPAA